MNQVDSNDRRLDPARLLQCLRDEHRALERGRVDGELELFHRASVVLRVGRTDKSDPVLRGIGREDGVAVRIVRSGRGDERFAAASGSGSRSLRWALENARSLGSRGAGGARPWAAGPVELSDREEVDRLPSPAELSSWLARSWERLRSGPAVGGLVEPESGWVEAAATVECLVGSGGLAAVRTRTRAWAMARMRALDPAVRAPRPLFVASRRWDRLPECGWAAAAKERLWSGGALAGSWGGRSNVTFTPEAAALLVAGLVRALHTGAGSSAIPVGPGWSVADDPLGPASLFGAQFDDAGFPTRRRTLADGERGTGAVAGPGTLRRPSFRDPPQELPFQPVLEAGEEDPGDHGLRVSELAIHPLPDGSWVLECDGILRRGAEWGPLVRGGLISTRPATLVRSCAARVGPARPSHRGVLTPALRFEGLRVRI